MKKYFLKFLPALAVLLFCSQAPAQWSLKTNTEDGRYSLATNSSSFFGISGGSILTEAVFAVSASDTSAWRLVSNTDNGLYSLAQNKIPFMGIDSGKVKTKAVYILNPSTLLSLGLDTNNIAYLNKPNTFTGNFIQNAPSVTGSSSTSAVSISQTWNTTGTPVAFIMNITNTSSNAASRLLDFKVGGNSKFAIDKDGLIISNGGYFGGYSGGLNIHYSGSNGFAVYNNTGSVKYVDISNSTGALAYTPAGLSGSGSTTAFSLTQTWNTTGTPTAFLMNITNTASNISSLLMDLQANSSSVFSIRRDGRVTAGSFISLSDINAGANNGISFTGRTQISAPSAGSLLIVNTTGSTGAAINAGNHLPTILNTFSLGSNTLYYTSAFTNNLSTRDTTLTTSASITVSFPEKILVDATAGNITLTFPNDATLRNYNYRIKRIDNSGNTVTLSTSGSIDDAPTKSVLYNVAYSISCTGNGVYKLF